MTALGINPRFQSPYAFLQAAGSDGSDLTSVGIDLRWTFNRSLGQNHLPKGDLAAPGQPFQTTIGFSRADDYVRIYKAPYSNKFFSAFVRLADTSKTVIETAGTRRWRYSGIRFIPEAPTITSILELRFTDVMLYDFVKMSVSPVADQMEFLRRYPGRIEMEVLGRHLLNICVNFEPHVVDPSDTGPVVRGEAIATRNRFFPPDLYVTCRDQVETNEPARLCFTCEDIHHIRFAYKNCFPVSVDLQPYEDYIHGVFLRENLDWQPVGKFSLTLDDGRAEAALINAPHKDVDGRWPKFNEADPATGAFVVRTDNYLDRWHQSEGLKHAVTRYLELSRVDPRAIELVSDPSSQPNEASAEISYLDSLNIVAQDYHVARMLGLGHIDHDEKTLKVPTVYLLEYVTEGQLEPFGPSVKVTHYSMTPPVTSFDFRLPFAPVLREPRYGLFHQPIENEPPHLLTDENGYAGFEPSRWINLDRDPFEFEGPPPPFGSGDPKYCFCDATAPAMYGVEYRKLGEPSFRRPEINHDPAFQDGASIAETVGVLELGQNPVFTHVETEEGVHQYALYSVNWFARISPLSNIVSTDDTRFPVLRNLEPPASFAVQLVQTEDPLIFTTAAEQAQLAAMPGPDKTLVRVTFEWDQVHNIAYQFADQVEMFFREAIPESILGQISTAAGSITQLANHLVRVRTAPQTIASANPPEVRQPFLLPAEKARYVGGNFVCEGRAYVIDDVEFPNPSGNDPSFIVRQVRETSQVQGTDPDDPNELITQETFAGPSTPGRPFMAVENVSPPENWDAQLARTVYVEPFHEGWFVRVAGSLLNDREYTIAAVAFAGGQTRLTVREEISSASAPFGNLRYRRRARVIGANPATSEITVAVDLTAGPGALALGMAVRLYGARENAGSYTVAAVSGTTVRVTGALTSDVAAGYLDYQKQIPIAAADPATKQFSVAGDLTAELAPPRIETVLEEDGTTTELVIGGLTGTATIIELPDGASPRSGVFRISFDSLVLDDHVDPSIEWYHGTVRILEDASLFPPSGDPTFRPPERKVLTIWEIDQNGPALQLTVFDPTFDPAFDPASAPVDPRAEYVPIATGAGVEVNAHPGYRLYLLAETHFDQSTILPAVNEGTRKTAMAARSADSAVPAFSPLTPPVVLLAQELRDPVPPGVPAGPLFATRPDFYGKATYTFDVGVNAPFSLVFYRGTDRGILDALYAPSTSAQILADLAALERPDSDFDNSRWRDLAGGVTDETDQFPQYVPGGYRFPVPDNDRYILPNEDPAVKIRPFIFGTLPGQISASVRRAIEGSFVPLTAIPIIYSFLNAGTVTSSRPPVTRDPGGNILLPGDPDYDPWPMAVRLPSGGVRFTDYALDGAALDRYFYFGIELSNRMIRSERGPMAGPVTLVNSSPPVAPVIRDLRVRTANPVMGLRAAVVFALNPYLESDSVVAFRVYRTASPSAAATVRDMELAKTIEAGEEVLDDFEGLDFPPFGDRLFYRIVALRKFVNENGQDELAPSFPSAVREVTLIDDVVPPPPDLAYSFGTPAGSPLLLPGVTLTWSRTAWNPRYHLFKMNPRGNWVKVHTLATNAPLITLDLADTELATNVLAKETSAGATIYHRFKVVTENSSGLLSNKEKPLVI